MIYCHDCGEPIKGRPRRVNVPAGGVGAFGPRWFNVTVYQAVSLCGPCAADREEEEDRRRASLNRALGCAMVAVLSGCLLVFGYLAFMVFKPY